MGAGLFFLQALQAHNDEASRGDLGSRICGACGGNITNNLRVLQPMSQRPEFEAHSQIWKPGSSLVIGRHRTLNQRQATKLLLNHCG